MARSYPVEAILAVDPIVDETGAERPFGTEVDDPLPDYFAGNYGDFQGTRKFIGYFGFPSQEDYDAYLANPQVQVAPDGAFAILNRHVDNPKTPAQWLSYFKGE